MAHGIGRQASGGYTVDEAAQFLQYDRASVTYWLRTGHLAGRRDPRSGGWLVSADDLARFVRASNEPMPTGSTGVPREPRLRLSAASD